MLKHTCLLLVGLLAVRADMMQMQAMPGSMPSMPNIGMLPPPPPSGVLNMLPPPPPQMTFEQLTQMGVKQSQAAGTSAAVGNAAGLGQGAATSINQANHQAGQGTSLATGLSANTATGTLGAAANGATQAVGSVNDFAAMQANFGKATQVGGSLLPSPPMSFGQMAGAQQAVKQDQATGSGAGAGNAAAQGAGSASSINQATQQAGNGTTSASGLSANTATGTQGAVAGGAAQAGGSLSSLSSLQSSLANANVQRLKRQLRTLNDILELADASAIGGGSAQLGKIQVQGNSRTNTNRFSASGFASGSAAGQGQGISVFDVAKSDSKSQFRARRDSDLFDAISEIADASALGTGKAKVGKVRTSESSRTHTDRFSADGSASGSASGEGEQISILGLAKSNSKSSFSRRARRDLFDSITEIADASALGTGKAGRGKVQNSESSRTHTDRFKADASSSGSASGEGEDISIAELAKSHSESRFSNRQRRQADQVFDSIAEIADASALGTGKVRRGKIQNSENSRTHTDRLNSDASASGSASGEGEDVSIAELVKSHSESRFANRQRRQAELFDSISEIADASALGTGKVKKGKVQTSESSRTHTDRLDSDASAAGSASGEGEEVSIVDLAKSHSGSRFSHRARREADLFKTLSDFADASALGGGSAVEGKVRTQNNGSTFSNQLRALGLASGVTFGEGKGINVFDAANTHSQSDFRFKRDTLRRIVNSADGNARGSASVDSGDVSLSETGSSNSNLFGASAFAAGSAAGSGQGVRLAEVANTEAKSGALRDVVRTPEVDINSDASASGRGSGSVDLGSLSSDDQSFSQTRRDSAFSRANANGAGKGRSVKLSESANAHSDTQSVFAAL